MKDIDFLPEWYKEDRRQRVHVRRQYAILTIAFMVMIGYNATSMHRITRAGAELARLESRRVQAQSAFDEFNAITGNLNKVREKADLIERIDSKINMSAVLAEMSHIVGETVVVSQVQFTAEPFSEEEKSPGPGNTGVRIAGGTNSAPGKTPVGSVRFRIILTGVAASPADVAALVRRLDDSSYFHRVHASFWRNGKVQVSARAGLGARGNAASGAQGETLTVTEFEIVCTLANYQETNDR